MDILRVTAVWSGFNGAPGYSVFHFSTDNGFWDGGLFREEAQLAAEGAAARVATAFSSISAFLPSSASVTIQPEAVVLDSNSGEALGFAEVESDTVEGGSNTYDVAGPAGAVVNWRTNDYRFGRRIRGRTFLVPLNVNAYETDGTLSNTARTAVGNFANTMVTGEGGADFGVWSRPRDGSGGVFASATGYNVPDMVAVLRSRRD